MKNLGTRLSDAADNITNLINIPIALDNFCRSRRGRARKLRTLHYIDNLRVPLHRLNGRQLLGPRKVVVPKQMHLGQVGLHRSGRHKREECIGAVLRKAVGKSAQKQSTERAAEPWVTRQTVRLCFRSMYAPNALGSR